ncbi:MAG: helix-turn-helix domain-containing protein [Chloroflexi bacterium]|nr:helix-turn-helix domain-containing protein [Chloroflexota bacterium]
MQKVGDIAKNRVERVIFENKMMQAGFAALPYLVMRDTNLSLGARLTYAFLLMYAWQEGSCFTRQTKMADAIGVSRRALQRYIYELRNTEYIAIDRTDKRFNNTYKILDKGPTKLKKRKRPQFELDAPPMTHRMRHR